MQGAKAVAPSVWASLQKGKWCHDKQVRSQLSHDLHCLRSGQVLPADGIKEIQSCFQIHGGFQVCLMRYSYAVLLDAAHSGLVIMRCCQTHMTMLPRNMNWVMCII